jgi:hypothetical protein
VRVHGSRASFCPPPPLRGPGGPRGESEAGRGRGGPSYVRDGGGENEPLVPRAAAPVPRPTGGRGRDGGPRAGAPRCGGRPGGPSEEGGPRAPPCPEPGRATRPARPPRAEARRASTWEGLGVRTEKAGHPPRIARRWGVRLHVTGQGVRPPRTLPGVGEGPRRPPGAYASPSVQVGVRWGGHARCPRRPDPRRADGGLRGDGHLPTEADVGGGRAPSWQASPAPPLDSHRGAR